MLIGSSVRFDVHGSEAHGDPSGHFDDRSRLAHRLLPTNIGAIKVPLTRETQRRFENDSVVPFDEQPASFAAHGLHDCAVAWMRADAGHGVETKGRSTDECGPHRCRGA